MRIKRTFPAATILALAFTLLQSPLLAGPFDRKASGTIVTSEPSEAMVFLDDHYVGLTPVALPAVRKGTHLLRLERQNYQPTVEAVDLGSPRTLNYTLKQVPEGTLQVVSDPIGAEVWINGTLKGTTPLKLEALPGGEVEVRLTRSSFEPWTGNALIEPGKTTQVGGTLVLRQEDFYLSKVNANPNDSSLALELAHIRLVKGNYDGAMEQYERAVEIATVGNDSSGQSNRVYPEIEKIYTGQVDVGGDLAFQTVQKKIREAFERLMDRHPDNPNICKQLARYYGREGEQLKAAEVFERYADHVPGDVPAFLSAGEQYVAAGSPERAIAVYEKARTLFPNHYLIYQRLGSTYLLQYQGGDASAKPRAIDALRKAEGLCTQSPAKSQIRKALEMLGEKPRD